MRGRLPAPPPKGPSLTAALSPDVQGNASANLAPAAPGDRALQAPPSPADPPSPTAETEA